MKKSFLLLIAPLTLLLPPATQAQSILNGSFETNIILDDSLSLTEPSFDNSVSYCHTVDGGIMDVISSSTYCGGAPDGSFFIQNAYSEYYGAFSMELSYPLMPGTLYNLTFWSRQCAGVPGSISIGESMYDSIIGTPFWTVSTAGQTTWTMNNHSFTPSMAAPVLTVDMPNSGLNSQMQVDNFVLTIELSAPEPSGKSAVQVSPNPASEVIHIDSQGEGVFQLYDSKGVRVLTSALKRGNTELPCSSLSPGLYIWVSEATSGETHRGKLVIE